MATERPIPDTDDERAVDALAAQAMIEPESSADEPLEDEQLPTTRVLVVDDDAAIRDMLQVLLSLYPEIEIVGEARDGAEAIEQADRLDPDVVVLDLMMPRMAGDEALPVLLERHPGMRVLVLTAMAETVSEEVVRLATVVAKTKVATDLVPALLASV